MYLFLNVYIVNVFIEAELQTRHAIRIRQRKKRKTHKANGVKSLGEGTHFPHWSLKINTFENQPSLARQELG